MFQQKNLKHLKGKGASQASVPRSPAVQGPVRDSKRQTLLAKDKKLKNGRVHTLSTFREMKSRSLSKLSRAPLVDIEELVRPCELKGCLRDQTERVKTETPSPMMSEFMDPRTTYKFLLKGFATIASNASGVVATFIPMDPSSTGFNFSEWPNLSALFTEFRIRSFTVQFVGETQFLTPGVAMFVAPLAIGSNTGISATPTSIGQVVNQADGRFWKGSMETTDTGYWHRVKPYDIGWSLTSSVTATPYAGAPGCIQIYGTSQGVSTNVALAMVLGEYEFRTRF